MAKINRGFLVYRLAEHGSESVLYMKDNDLKVYKAIMILFESKDDIEIFNKKALYIYIREIIDVKTPKITKISNELYDIFKTNYVFYLSFYKRFTTTSLYLEVTIVDQIGIEPITY